ncbi:hypothetical protein [Catenuloplanes indicus]|uniref:Uncharacterized protein n=1 Tax=Catenuloplanes indicus TaxID=137267 RepID=A0AAE4AXQ2_9ACTN|nr:hypothetical protein [Catenuloplanes indicus]MDQ0364263.1 hypothetical protein [Catenuloplanes indicus]
MTETTGRHHGLGRASRTGWNGAAGSDPDAGLRAGRFGLAHGAEPAGEVPIMGTTSRTCRHRSPWTA